MAKGYWFVLVLALLTIAGTLRMEQSMSHYGTHELIALLGLTVLAVAAFSLFGVHARVGWILLGVFFIGALLNTLALLFWSSPPRTIATGVLMLQLLGLLISGMKMALTSGEDRDSSIEVYETKSENRAPAKRGRKRGRRRRNA